jgi:hypothetical protein
MEALLTVIVTWLSISFGLPATYDHPQVEIVPALKMAAVRYSRLRAIGTDRLTAEAGRTAPPEVGMDVHAVYDDKSRTIYLHEGWSDKSPADVSVLVHELVHHLQNVAGSRYSCPQEREKAAYAAQARWLELFGRTLADAFELDPMTVLVRTNCMW